MTKKAVVLFSGGLDSTTVLAIAKAENYEIHALSVVYGQKHIAEMNAAKAIAKSFDVKQHLVMELPLYHLQSSSLISDELNVNDYSASSDIPNTYVPARNTVFLSLALGLAEEIGANDIFIGVSAIDYSGYPDCRSEYIHAFETMANLATKAGVNGEKLHIHTPLIQLSKAETVLEGLRLGVDYSKTVSCYRADRQGRACGRCDSCMLRKQGFIDANVDDPTVYC